MYLTEFNEILETYTDTWDKFVYAGVGSGGIQAPVLTTKVLDAHALEYWKKSPIPNFLSPMILLIAASMQWI